MLNLNLHQTIRCELDFRTEQETTLSDHVILRLCELNQDSGLSRKQPYLTTLSWGFVSWTRIQDWAGDNLTWPRYPEALWAEPGFRTEQETTLPDHVIQRLCELNQDSGLSRRQPYLTTLSWGFVSWTRIQDWAGDSLTWPRYPEALWAEPGFRTEQETTLPDHVILRLCELSQDSGLSRRQPYLTTLSWGFVSWTRIQDWAGDSLTWPRYPEALWAEPGFRTEQETALPDHVILRLCELSQDSGLSRRQPYLTTLSWGFVSWARIQDWAGDNLTWPRYPEALWAEPGVRTEQETALPDHVIPRLCELNQDSGLSRRQPYLTTLSWGFVSWARSQDWAGDSLTWPRYPEALWAEPGFRTEQETTLPDHVILRLCELSQDSGLSRRQPYLTTLSWGFVSWTRIQDWAGDSLTWPRYPEALWAEPGFRTEQETTLPDHVILRLCELSQDSGLSRRQPYLTTLSWGFVSWTRIQDWAGDSLTWPRYPEALWAEPGFRTEQETALPDHVILRLCELSQDSGLSRRQPYLTTLSWGFVSWTRIQDWAGDNLTWPRYPEALWAEPGFRTEQETTLPDHVILRLCELSQDSGLSRRQPYLTTLSWGFVSWARIQDWAGDNLTWPRYPEALWAEPGFRTEQETALPDHVILRLCELSQDSGLSRRQPYLTTLSWGFVSWARIQDWAGDSLTWPRYPEALWAEPGFRTEQETALPDHVILRLCELNQDSGLSRRQPYLTTLSWGFVSWARIQDWAGDNLTWPRYPEALWAEPGFRVEQETTLPDHVIQRLCELNQDSGLSRRQPYLTTLSWGFVSWTRIQDFIKTSPKWLPQEIWIRHSD